MTDIETALRNHFDDEQVPAIATVLRAGAAYAEGDAMAGAKLQNVTQEDWERITEVFNDADFEVEFNSRMSVVSFVSPPETDDEQLNEAIRDL